MRAIEAVTAKGETSALCQSIGVSRASLYRRRRPTPPATPRRPRAPSPRALVPAERRAVRDTLHSARFVDQSPAEVYATLLEEQTYLCSPRTMYRVLAAADEVRERRDQVRHPAYGKPELVATAPNQVWSWDITKLKGPVPYLYYSLYVILDLFSRYVVGWMVAVKESAHLAERLIEQTCAKQRIQPQQLTIHADRGAPMRSKLVALLFSDLGIAASHSRPRAGDPRPASPHPPRGLRRASGAIRQRATTPRNLADRRVDQSAVENHPPGCPRTDDRHPGRLAACGRCPAATAARSVVVAPRRWRGVATVNAEPGCLKDVDTARYPRFRLLERCDHQQVDEPLAFPVPPRLL